MKKLTLFVLLFCFITSLSACSNTEPNINDEQQTVTEPKNYLEVFNGYWKRPDDYVSEGISLVDQFEVYAAGDIWIPYDEYGNFSDAMPCYADENTLTLDFMLNTATFYLEDGNLTDGEGNIHFIPTDFEVNEEAMISKEAIQGTWYKFGNVEGDTFILSEDGSYEHYYSSGYLAHDSTWTFSPSSRGTLDGSFVDTQILTMTEMDSFFDVSFYNIDNKLMTDSRNMVDGMWNDFYVHESVIDDASLYIDIGNLLTISWKSGVSLSEIEGIYGLKFEDTPDKRFYTSTLEPNVDGDSYQVNYTFTGNWDMPEVGKLIITFTDGTVEEISYDGTVIEIDYFGQAFASNGHLPASHLVNDNYYIGTWLNYTVEETIVFHDESTYTITSGDTSKEGNYTADDLNVTFYYGDSVVEAIVDGDGDIYIDNSDVFNGGYYYKYD